MNEPGTAGTSATGARSQLMPSARSSRPVSSPWRCDSATGRSPSCGGAMSGGAHASRLTAPPSWSTQTSGAGAPPARAATRILAVSARTWSGVAMFRENSTTPPADPVRSCASNEAGADVPRKATISRCPTRRASGTGGGGGGAGALLEGGGDVAGGGGAPAEPCDELPLHAVAARQNAAIGSARYTGPAYDGYQVFQQR